MDRVNRAKHLADRLRELYEQDVTEQEAYNQLKGEFATIRLAKVNTFYNKFRDESRKAPKKKAPAVDKAVLEMIKRTDQVRFED